MRNHLICPFVSDAPQDETLFPQMSGRSSSNAFKNTYWRCMAVLFASYRRFDRAAACSIVTNADPSTYCDPQILRMLEELQVAISVVPFARKQQVVTGRFGNVLYVFDVLEALHRRPEHERVLLLDPDCLFAQDPAPIWRAIAARGLIYYDVGTPAEDNIAGLSLAWLGQFATRNGWSTASPMTHAGGEFLGLDRAALERLRATAETVMASRNGALLTVEEHVLSLAVAIRGLGDHTANAHVRRIWTGPRRRNARPEDFGLIVWHLPREKEFGLADLYWELVDRPGPARWVALPAQEYVTHLAGRLGIPGWSARKWLRELPRLLERALRK